MKENRPQTSDKATDKNWAGAKYTSDVVKSGYYKDNEVSIYVD